MMTRREFIKAGTITGTGLLFPITLRSHYAHAARNKRRFMPSPVLTKYLDQLPIPGQAFPTFNPTSGFHELYLSMTNSSYSFHSQLGMAQTFGYGGAPYLGPTIIAQQGQPIKLTATNNLGQHPLTAMVTPDPMNVMNVQPQDAASPRSAIHLHGGYNRCDSDGGPMDFFPRNMTNPALAGNSFTYTFANDQQSATLWYHDHAVGLTRANVYAGLAGYYLLRDSFDTGSSGNPLGLPAGYGTYEIPLVIQDKSFNANGTLFYAPTSAWIPEFFGDVAVVNGKAWPNLNVQQAVYRFRVINGSNARFYDLKLSDGNLIYQIGTDNGLLDAPVALSNLVIGPGERADILIDFTGSAIGSKIILQNFAPAPYPNGKRILVGPPIPEIMQITVSASAGVGATTTIPTNIRGGVGQPPLLTQLSAYTASVVRQRFMVLFEIAGPAGTPIGSTINVLEFPASQLGPNGISVRGGGAVSKDTLEQWNIINMTVDTHPIHTHLTNFQILDRQNIDTIQYQNAMIAAGGTRMFTAMGTSVAVPNTTATALPDPAPFFIGTAIPPMANEQGWKDTIHVPPGQVTRILVPFGNQALGPGVPGIHFGELVTAANVTPYNNPAEFNGSFTGNYVWHCHILDHEENDMMNMYQII